MTGHLIHIGYPKTGSNFLRRWFAAHPQLSYREGAIGGFANVLDIVRQGEAAPAQPAFRVTSSEGLATPHADIGADPSDPDRGHQRSTPAAQAAVCATLAAIFPNAHILIVTRGFRSMILSAYSQYVRTGGELALDRFIAPRDGGLAARDDVWSYSQLVGLYRDAFADRVITLPYELLRDHPARFIREIESRLGIDHQDLLPERRNASLTPVELAWYPRLTRRVRALPVGRRVRRKIERTYLGLAMANRLRRPIAILQRVRPLRPVTGELLTDEAVGAWRGLAEPLRGDPVYAPYAKDYLL
jgi:hypothetical protein